MTEPDDNNWKNRQIRVVTGILCQLKIPKAVNFKPQNFIRIYRIVEQHAKKNNVPNLSLVSWNKKHEAKVFTIKKYEKLHNERMLIEACNRTQSTVETKRDGGVR